MKPSNLFIAYLVGLATAGAQADAPDAEKPKGQLLFEQHGCTNCHGADGVHPEARYVPVLRGKPAADLYAHAKQIFGGASSSEKTVFMHDQFCIGQVQEEGCYEPPSDADLRVIADWLGGGELAEKKQTPQGLYVSAMEAHERLQELGDDALFIDVRSEVYSVTDGFEGDKAKAGPRKGERVVNGWKNAGLPWTYTLDKSAMYWEL